MDTTPLISVIVPIYNVEEFLRPCLDSIIRQTYTNLEIICVNDGSTDNSQAILDEYAAKDSRIRIIKQPNAGLSAARNTALEYCRGEFVTGIDSDDYWSTDIIEKAIRYLDDDIDMLCFGMQPVWEGPQDEQSDNFLRSYLALNLSGKFRADSDTLKHINVCFCAKLWRRSVIERYRMRFAQGLRYEDSGFFALCMPDCRYAYILPEIGYFYRQRSSSIMGGTREKPELQLEYFDELMYVAEQYTLHRRWDRDMGYISDLMCKALYHICTHGEMRLKECREAIFRLVTEHRLLSAMPRMSIAILFSPFRPTLGGYNSSSWRKKCCYLPHYIVGLIRYGIALRFPRKQH